jgi:hypothetical protein
MEAIEFETTAKDGTIQIPETYKNKFTARVRVVVMREEAARESDPRPQFGSAKGEVWMSDDFDEPLDMFKDYGPSQ